MGSCGWQGLAALLGSCHTSILGRHHLWECGTPLEGVPHSCGFHAPTQWCTDLPVPLKINSGTCRDLSYICTFPQSHDTYGPPACNYVMMAGKPLMSLI